MGKLLSLVSVIIGVVDVAALYALMRAFAFASIQYDPEHPLSSVYGVRLVEQGGIIVIGLVCLVGIFVLLHYYDEARTQAVLLRRFTKVTVVQLAAIVLAYIPPLVRSLLAG
jgi:hypothetical protein